MSLNRTMATDTGASFTQKQKQKQRLRQEEHRRNRIDQNFLMFMSTLHDHYAHVRGIKKKAGPRPRRSPESIVLNPTALTSDPTVEMEHNIDDLQEEQDNLFDPDADQIDNSRPSKKSLIPVWSPRHASITSLKNSLGRILTGHDTHDTQTIGGTVQSTSVLPDTIARDGSMKYNTALIKCLRDQLIIHSNTQNKPSSLIPPDGGILEKKWLFQNHLAIGGLVKSSESSSRPDPGSGDSTRVPTVVSSERDFIEQIDPNGEVLDRKKNQSTGLANYGRQRKSNESGQQKSNESETTLKIRGGVSMDGNIKALRKAALTTVQRPAHTVTRPSNVSRVKDPQHALTNKHMKSEKRAASNVKNVEIKQTSQYLSQFTVTRKVPPNNDLPVVKKTTSKKAENLLLKKQQNEGYSRYRRSQSLGPGTKSSIPVKMGPYQIENEGSHDAKQELSSTKTNPPETYSRSVANLPRNDTTKKKTTIGKKEFGLRPSRQESLLEREAPPNFTQASEDRTASLSNNKPYQLKTRKPPLPRHQLKPKVTIVKEQISKLPLRQNLSTKLSPPKVHNISTFTSPSLVTTVTKLPQTPRINPPPQERINPTSSPSETKCPMPQNDKTTTSVARHRFTSASMDSLPSFVNQFSLFSPPAYNPGAPHTKAIQTELICPKLTQTSSHDLFYRTTKKTQIPSASESVSSLQPKKMYNIIKQAIRQEQFSKPQTKAVKDTSSQTGGGRQQKTGQEMQAGVLAAFDKGTEVSEDDYHAAKTIRCLHDENSPPLGISQPLYEPVIPPNRKWADSGPSPSKDKMKTMGLTEIEDKRITNTSRRSTTGHEITSKTTSTGTELHAETVGPHAIPFTRFTTAQTFQKSTKRNQNPVFSCDEGDDYASSESDARSNSNEDPDSIGTTDDTDRDKLVNSDKRYVTLNPCQREAERARKIEETRNTRIAWNKSESDVLVRSSTCGYNNYNLRGTTEDKASAEETENGQKCKVYRAEDTNTHLMNSKRRLTNVGTSLAGRLEPTPRWLEEPLQDETGRMNTWDNPPECGRSDCPLNHQTRIKSLPCLDTLAPAQNKGILLGKPYEKTLNDDDDDDDNDDDDEDIDENILADMNEVLFQVSKTTKLLAQRVVTLQKDTTRLRSGLSLLLYPQVEPSQGGTQKWEGTLFDYIMLVGFMVIQFGFQYSLLKN